MTSVEKNAWVLGVVSERFDAILRDTVEAATAYGGMSGRKAGGGTQWRCFYANASR